MNPSNGQATRRGPGRPRRKPAASETRAPIAVPMTPTISYLAEQHVANMTPGDVRRLAAGLLANEWRRTIHAYIEPQED